MSLSKDAIQHIEAQALAASGKILEVSGATIAVVAESTALKNLEPFQVARNRFRGTMRTTALRDYVEYVNRHCVAETGPACFVDQDEMSAVVLFNLGTTQQAGHGDDAAELNLKPTAAFASLRGMVGRSLTQQQLAEWLEDWAPHIQAHAGDEMLPIASAITGIRKMTIKAVSQRDSTVGDLSGSRSSMDEIEARSQETLPTAFHFTVVPYEGLQPALIPLRLSVITGGDTPVLKLRWVAEEAQREAFAAEFKGVLASAISDSVPVTIGAFAVGK